MSEVNMMPVITKIKVQKNNKDRYSIFADFGRGEEYAFSVDEDVLIKYQLKKGMELDDLSVTEMLYQDDIRKAYNMAIQYLAHRMRSEGEVRERLKKKEVAEPIIQEAIQRLYKHRFLDDLEFAKAFVRTQMNTTDKGPELIKMSLKEKGVKGPVIDESIKEFVVEHQVDKAIELAQKNFIKNHKDSSRFLKQKTEQLLVRKGYPFNIIQIVMGELDTEKAVGEEMIALKYQAEKLQRKYIKFERYEQKQKMKQALYNKGFSIDLIEKCLVELFEDE